MSDTGTNRPDVVTRFAPSPTGHLHIGGVRTALFCWALAAGARARGQDGRFLLRVEDTDRARSSESAARGILEDLAWLGLDWDEGPGLTGESGRALGGDPRGVGPFYQAKRAEIYNKCFDRLLAEGVAFPAFESAEELSAQREQAAAEKRTYRYERVLGYDHAVALERMKTEEYVLRLHVPQETIEVRDEVMGDIAFTREHFDDFVIRKKDGFPTYHFAVVVDDEAMGVTHVVRGQEHLNNTPKHVALQHALGYGTPVYAHLPLIFNPDGSKMSKRDKDKAARQACKASGLNAPPGGTVDPARFAAWLKDKKSQLETDDLVALAASLRVELPEIDVEDFRRNGYLPEALLNYLALLGWNPGGDVERFETAFLAERFAFDRVGKSNSKFDRDKLRAFNGDAIAAMQPADFYTVWREWIGRHEPGVLEALAPVLEVAAAASQPRVKTLRESLDVLAYALAPDIAIEFDEKAAKKALHKGEPSGLEWLSRVKDELLAVEPFEPDAIDAFVAAYCEREGCGMGKIAQPLRVALTGTAVSPPLGQTLALLGRERVGARIERCLRMGAAERE